MRKKSPYIAKIVCTRNNYYKVYIAKSALRDSGIFFGHDRCTKDEYERCSLPEMSAGYTIQSAIRGSLKMEDLSTLYRQGRILGEAIPIAMEMLL